MILKTAQVTYYKCVMDSTLFKIDENVTCLVGKNESGKTTLLQALSKLNPIAGGDGDFTRMDFTRQRLDEFNEQHEAVATTWGLEDDDRKALLPVIGPTAEQIEDCRVSKRFDNKRYWKFNLDEAAVVGHLIKQFQLSEGEKSRVNPSKTVQGLRANLESIADPSQRQKQLRDHVVTTFADTSAFEAAKGVLSERLPKFGYFSEYLRMPGKLALDDLKKRLPNPQALTDSDKVFLALLAMIGRDVEQLETLTQFEPLIAELEGASNAITKQLYAYWTQNRHLRVQFRFDQGQRGDPPPFNAGYILRTRIENTRHGVTTDFDQRSAGFVWFFSFLVWFSQVKKNYGDNVVLLLDEPGLSLHAKAQSDLLRYIEEKLVERSQVIYTTHSPFMIDPANLFRARTVEDVYIEAKSDGTQPPQELGTKVGDDILSTDLDTVSPLQACLGYEITQTLFIGKHTILVEGPSDLLYLKWFQRKLKELNRTKLDPRWTIVPCGGIDKIGAFLALFGGNRIHIAVLTDFTQGQKNKIRDLRDSKLLRAGHVFSAEMYVAKPEADIEDMIGNDAYTNLVNKCYSLTVPKAVPAANTDPVGPLRIVKRVEDHFRTLKSAAPEWDHYRPAEFLVESGLKLSLTGIDFALERFELLFKDLNAVIK